MATVTITIQDQEDNSVTIDISSKNPSFPNFDELKEGENAETTFAQAIGLALYGYAYDILENKEEKANDG